MTRGTVVCGESSAGPLFVRAGNEAGDWLPDCYFLVVTREGWTPQPRTARNLATATMPFRRCEILGRLNVAPAFACTVVAFGLLLIGIGPRIRPRFGAR